MNLLHLQSKRVLVRSSKHRVTQGAVPNRFLSPHRNRQAFNERRVDGQFHRFVVAEDLDRSIESGDIVKPGLVRYRKTGVSEETAVGLWLASER